MSAVPGGARPRVGLVLEQTLGHVTHSSNLRRLLPGTAIDPVFAPIEFPREGWARRVPGYGNWTVRAGLRARRAIRSLRRSPPGIDALFVHTQVPAMLSPDLVRRLPSALSLDATPIQYDALGASYQHRPRGRTLESAKRTVHRLGFTGADALVTWSTWSKSSLVDDYGIEPDKITVIPPGVDLEQWAVPDRDDDGRRRRTGHAASGDLERKGGSVLIRAVESLRGRGVDVELDLVTRDKVARRPGVRDHQGLAPNDPALVALYRDADVFCLPTLGDCLPMVLSEAGAVGLPLVATAVGAIDEIVRDDTGVVVPVGDASALADALADLARDPDQRARLGANARRLVETEFDASANAARLAALLAGLTRR